MQLKCVLGSGLPNNLAISTKLEYEGENTLGILLMVLREQLVNEQSNNIETTSTLTDNTVHLHLRIHHLFSTHLPVNHQLLEYSIFISK